MKHVSWHPLMLILFLLTTGCTKVAKFDGPTVDAFEGQLVSEGKPVSFSDDKEVVKVFLVHKGSGERFRIPIRPDGTFGIGWMPVGDFNCRLERKKKGGFEVQGMEFETQFKPVPGGLTIEDR